MPFEILNFPLVLFCRRQRTECPEIGTSASLTIFLARIQTILARLELAYHDKHPTPWLTEHGKRYRRTHRIRIGTFLQRRTTAARYRNPQRQQTDA